MVAPADRRNGHTDSVSEVTTAVDRAYTTLRDALVAGQFQPGTPLREEVIAAMAGVSRTPVREAIRRLDAEGLVEVLPNRGARVADWDDHDVEEIFELRVLLEGYGARLAAKWAGEAELAQLTELCQQMEAEVARPDVRYEVVTDINARFHQVILAAGPNRRLASVTAGVVKRALVIRTFHLYTSEELARSCAHHRELVAAVSANDGDWAEAVMRAHLYAGERTARRRQ